MESATATARPAVSAGPIRAIRAAWAWVRRNGFKIYTGFALAYMLVPIAVIAVFSFADASENRDHLAFAINNGFTLKYWEHAFSIPDLNTALFTSFRLAALATLISTVIGTLMAIALVRYRFHGRGAANLLLVLPMATPEIVMGASLLSLFLIYGVALGFTSLLIAHIMFCISFVVVVVRSRLIGFDRSIEDAAADLGATPIATFRYITLPLLRPGILGAALLAFALSVDDFIVSDFNKGTTETFPIYVFGAHLRGIPVQVNVLATMLFALVVTAICFVLWQQRRAERMASVRPEQEV
jgi:spermidine/putrescine transport system permease protein